MKRTLIILAKHPHPGRVKSRLAAETSPEWAAELARASLLDTLERTATLPVRRVLAYDPPDARDAFAAWAANRFELAPQVAGDLGSRMAALVEAELPSATHAVVLIGADSPHLPLSHITEAFEALPAADVVLGPTTDGGYFLLGLARHVAKLFQGIAWGTPSVLGQSVERVRTAACRLALLPLWYDLDSLADCKTLRGHLDALRLAGQELQLPNVQFALKKLRTT